MPHRSSVYSRRKAMLLGRPLRDEISRSGSASPELRKAESTCDECTTDFTRYGSRAGGFGLMVPAGPGELPRCCRDGVGTGALSPTVSRSATLVVFDTVTN